MEAERIERKLSAILAAGVVRYSRPTGADDDATLASLNLRRRQLFNLCVNTHRGNLNHRQIES